MNSVKRSKFAKFVAGATGVAMALTLFVGVGVNTASAASLTAAQVNSILGLLQSFGADQATIDNVNSALTGAPTTGGTTGGSTTGGTSTGYTFTRNLTVGDTGEDVRQLQMILNSDAATQIAASGVGSAGNETTYFGGLTKSAVIKFQNKYSSEVLAPVGLSAGTGFVGASTRAKLNTMTSGTTSGGNTSGGNVTLPTGSGLTITEVPLNAGGFLTIPYNVSAMTFAKFNFTAGNSPVEITKLRIVRSELGDKDDFDEVWVTVNGMQKGNERSIVTGDYADFDLSNDKIVIGSGQTVVVEIRASLAGNASDAGHYNRLGFGSITANVPVQTTLPVNGPLTNISTQAAATVTMTAQGSDKTISVGNVQTEIGRFKLDVSSTNSQDVVVKEIKLENQGTSNDLAEVITNVKLKVGGTVVSSNVQLSGDVMTITLNDYLMEDGQTQSFTIVADVIAAETSDTIQLQLDEDSDLLAMESGSGAGVRVDGEDGSSTSPASNVDLKTYTVETGDVNFAIGNASSRSIAPGLDDVQLLDGTISVDSPIRADGIKVRLYSGTDTDNDTVADLDADFENVTLRIDGVALDVVDTLTNASGGASSEAFVTGTSGDYYNFDSKFTLEAGSHTVVVEGDVKSAATAADKIKLVIYSSDLDSPEYIASGDTVPSGELTGQIDGSLVTIQASSLVANRNDGFSSETIIGGSKEIEFFKFTLTANDSSEVRVNSITVQRDDSASTIAASNITNMKLFVDGVQKGSTIDLSSGTFTDADFVVPKSGQVQILVKLDTSTASTSASLGIEVTSVDATDEEGNSVTVTRASDSATISSSNTLTSDGFTVATGGTFTLSVDGDTTDEDVIVADGGSVWMPIVKYRATAENEDLKLTDLYLFNAATTTAILGGTGSTSYADARVQTLGLFDENGVLKAQKSLSNGLVAFNLGETENPSGLGPIIVPKDDTAKFEVRAKVNTIVDGDKTGRAIRLAIDPYNGTGDTGVTVQSTAVGSDLASTSIVAARDNDGGSANGTIRGTTTIASDLFSLRRTKPTITTVDQGSDTTLTNGSNQVLYKFTVSADSAEDIAWKGIKFDVRGTLGTTTLSTTTGEGTFVDTTAGSASGLTAATTSNELNKVTAFKLYNSSTNQELQNGSYSVQLDWDSTNDNGEVAIVLNNGVEETVSAGSSKTYELRATVAGGTSSNGNFISVTIDDEADDNSSTAAYYVEQADPDNVDNVDTGSIIMTANATSTSGYAPYTFLWSDFSGSPHSADNEISAADDKDWTNDRLISIDGGTWTRSYAN